MFGPQEGELEARRDLEAIPAPWLPAGVHTEHLPGTRPVFMALPPINIWTLKHCQGQKENENEKES